MSLHKDGPGPPDDTADSGDTPVPSDEGQVTAEEAPADVPLEPTTTDSEPLPEASGGGESPDAALDVPNWAADDQEPKEANFPPIEPVVENEGDAGHKEPDGADPTVSDPSCADPPSLLHYLF